MNGAGRGGHSRPSGPSCRAVVRARSAIVDELWTDLGFRLVGSEPGESAETRAALATLIAGLFAHPMRLSWAWRTRDVTRHADVAWLFAEGDLVATYSDREVRSPYRTVCVLQKVGEHWHWRLFCGSEPAPTA